jgi:DNA invertase Pin-like site-specific DNA recombinase
MLIGYVRVSTGDQTTDLQRDALIAAGIDPQNIYEDKASGKKDDRPGFAACLKALGQGDVLVTWKLDRIGRSLKHLVNTLDDLNKRGIGFKVLTGADIDTTTPTGRLVFGVLTSLSEFEHALIRERVMAGLAAARARGRKGGRKPAFTPSKLRRAQAAMASRDTHVTELCEELGVSRATLYNYVIPDGKLTTKGAALLASRL